MKEILNQHDYSSVNAGSPAPGGHLTSLCSQDHKQCIQHEPRISVCAGRARHGHLSLPPREQAGGIYRFFYYSEDIKNSWEVPKIERL